MKTYSYAAVFEPTGREDGLTVTFPDVPEAITQGDGMFDARAMAEDALGVALLTYLEIGRELPPPTAKGVMISPTPNAAMKIAVIETFRASGMTRSELARQMGKDEKEARRLLDPDVSTDAPLMVNALEAMGRDN